jgi:hypothetical protein
MRKYVKKVVKPDLRQVDKNAFDKLLKACIVIKAPKTKSV